MKVAVLLFGHLRTYEYSSKYFVENVKNKFDCDIFIHTWDTLDSLTQSWNGKKSEWGGRVNNKMVEQVMSIYSPKIIKVESQNIENDICVQSADGKKNVSILGMQYMFYSMKTANEMRKKYEKEHGVKYDYVLATRPDVAVYKPIDIQAIIDEAKFLNLDINNCRFFAGAYGDATTNVRLLVNRVCDILFFAKPEVIDRYIGVNQNFDVENIDGKFLNIVSIYLQNEILAGILPIQFCFAFDSDWRHIDNAYLQYLTQQTTGEQRAKEKKSFFIRAIGKLRKVVYGR